MAQNTPGQQLSDLLVTRGFSPEMLDSSGKAAPTAQDAEIFSFDFISSGGTNYGTVVVMLGDDKQLEVFSGDNVGRGMDSEDKTEWYEFQHQLKNFATKNFMTFGSQNINRLKYSMQGQAALKEGLFESWNGTKNVSWNGGPDSVRLMIRHKRPMGVTESRFRQVESLFVETADGERYKLPFTKLSGGRAMVEHVRQGGKPYDMRGTHIATIVEELNVLSRFRRAAHGKIFEGDTANLVTETNEYYSTLNKTLKGLASGRGYSGYFESWNPADITEQDVIIENIKTLFVQETIDSRIEQALPILARIQQQGNAMKEANIFEAWADRLVEGIWATPDTPEAQQELIALLSAELPVGADATNATEQLKSLFGDDVLFDQLQELAAADANADGRELIIARMKELADTNTDIGKVVDALDSAVPDAGEDAESDEVLDQAEDDYDFQDDIAETDADASVDRIRELSGLSHSVDGGMNNDILQDGALGSIAGGVLGAALTKSPGGAMTGAKLGSAAQDAVFGADEEVEEGMEDLKMLPRQGNETNDERQARLGAKLDHEFKTKTGQFANYNDNPYPSLNQYNAHGDDEYQAKKLKKEQGMEEGEHSQHYMDANEPNARDYADEKLADIRPMGFKQDPVQATTDRALKYGAKGVDKIRDLFRKTDEESFATTGNPPLEEDADQYSVLSGQYGHSGKMQKFDDVEQDILTRLKQLSGMLRSS